MLKPFLDAIRTRAAVRLALGLALAGGLLLAFLLPWGGSQTLYGYVVGEDSRIYMANLDAGELEWVSRRIGQVVGPVESEIDVNPEESILYIGNNPVNRFLGPDEFPLVAVRLNEAADVVFETPSMENVLLPGRSTLVFDVRLNPNGKSLYVGFVTTERLRTVLDALTGEVLGGLDVPVKKDHVFSPDGKMLASVFPAQTWTFESGRIEEMQAGVVVWDMESGEELSYVQLEGNRGMVPPWGAEESHLVHVDNRGVLKVYDRASGELLAEHDTYDLAIAAGAGQSGLGYQNYATPLPGRRDVAMSIYDSVIVFDPLTGEVKSRTRIGDIAFTEVVVSDQPPLWSRD